MLTSVKLTVLFENPFWIGVFEIEEKESYKVCKVTFGAEPKDSDVLQFILSKYYKLGFSEKIESNKKFASSKENPKRIQRAIRKEIKNNGIGTKAQNAIKEQHELNKIEHKKRTKEEKENELMRKFEMKRNKKKEKHKGH